MMKIFIENLVFRGIHGATPKEKERAQPFRIDIEVTAPFSGKDDIRSTTDYRIVKKIVRQVIEEEQYNLLEAIAHRIATLIKESLEVTSARVTVRKLEIWDNGVPGVTVEL